MSGLDSLPIPAPIDMESVQAKLAADELVLHYTLTDQYLYVLLISNDTVSVQRLASKTELDQVLQKRVITSGSNSIAIADLQQLSQLLLPSSAELASYSQLLIVPHSGLYQIPFAALPVNNTASTYSALASEHTIKVLPSLSVYFMDKPATPAGNSSNIAVIADPEFAGAESLALASLSESEQVRSWSQSLVPLPYSAQEANKLSEIFGMDNVQQYIGRRASRANLVSSNVRNAKILHIATHGYFKSTSEDNVGLALSTITEDGLPDPGYITLTELFSYRFANELVVISGCDTAMGLEQQGEGLNSLARGFLSRGSRHVISTLWPVSDKASARFMALFYQNLQQTQDVALAMQAVQKSFMADPLYRNPYYWAGYVLTTVEPNSKLVL
jgi:CHAT domain-containing protein